MHIHSFNPCFSGNFCNIYLPLKPSFGGLSFNPCFSGNFCNEKMRWMNEEYPEIKFQSLLFWKFLQHIDKEYIVSLYNESFNPCFSGNFCNQKMPLLQHIYPLCFNPCFSGNFCNKKEEKKLGGGENKFQSLLFWKFLQHF